MNAPTSPTPASEQPSKGLQAFAFVVAIAICIVLANVFHFTISPSAMKVEVLAVLSFVTVAVAWLSKALRVATTHVLLPFLMLFVVVRDEEIVGVKFWAVGVILLIFGVIFFLFL